VIEERASEIIKSKIQSLFRRESEASSSLKRNKWGQPVGGNVYAGFELELAGAECPLKQSGTASAEGVSIRHLEGLLREFAALCGHSLFCPSNSGLKEPHIGL
jgi:hypothetical protein